MRKARSSLGFARISREIAARVGGRADHLVALAEELHPLGLPLVEEVLGRDLQRLGVGAEALLGLLDHHLLDGLAEALLVAEDAAPLHEQAREVVRLEGLELEVGAEEAVVLLDIGEDATVPLDELGVAGGDAAGVGDVEVLEEVGRGLLALVEGVGASEAAGVVVGADGDAQQALGDGELAPLGRAVLLSDDAVLDGLLGGGLGLEVVPPSGLESAVGVVLGAEDPVQVGEPAQTHVGLHGKERRPGPDGVGDGGFRRGLQGRSEGDDALVVEVLQVAVGPGVLAEVRDVLVVEMLHLLGLGALGEHEPGVGSGEGRDLAPPQGHVVATARGVPLAGLGPRPPMRLLGDGAEVAGKLGGRDGRDDGGGGPAGRAQIVEEAREVARSRAKAQRSGSVTGTGRGAAAGLGVDEEGDGDGEGDAGEDGAFEVDDGVDALGLGQGHDLAGEPVGAEDDRALAQGLEEVYGPEVGEGYGRSHPRARGVAPGLAEWRVGDDGREAHPRGAEHGDDALDVGVGAAVADRAPLRCQVRGQVGGRVGAIRPGGEGRDEAGTRIFAVAFGDPGPPDVVAVEVYAVAGGPVEGGEQISRPGGRVEDGVRRADNLRDKAGQGLGREELLEADGGAAAAVFP